jgi:hypothetical protein
MNKKIFLSLILCLYSTISIASNWKEIAFNEKTKFYIDTKTVEKLSNSIYTFWLLNDFQKPIKLQNSPLSVSSTKSKVSINCKSKEFSISFNVAYTEKMGNGEVITSFKSSSEWEPIVPDSSNDRIREFLCG